MTKNNIVGRQSGIFRSIHGYAAESLVIGEALLAGYNLFFKAWRDSAYDAVLDYDGILFRIEIKGTSGDSSLTVTGGGRSGKQISRDAGSREHIVSPDDCEFLIGVSSLTRDCYIIPTECIAIFSQNSLSFRKIAPFKNAWRLFMGGDGISTKMRRDGFRSMDEQSLMSLCDSASLQVPSQPALKWDGFAAGTFTAQERKDAIVLNLWRHLASLANTSG